MKLGVKAPLCVTSFYIEGVHEDPISVTIGQIEKSLLNWEWFRIDRTEKDDVTGLVRHVGTLYRDGETLERGLFYRGRSFGMSGSVPLYRFVVDIYSDHMRVNVFEMRMVEAG